MIIEFDGYRINEYVIGRNCSLNKLKAMYLNVKMKGYLMKIFYVYFVCSIIMKLFQSHYKEAGMSDVVIDLDTDYIYIPNR